MTPSADMKKARKGRVLFVAQDLGGFNAILPVWKSMKSMPHFLVFFICPKKISGRASAYMENIFDKVQPDILVTGTSIGRSHDKTAVAIAKSRQIPSIAVLDFWSNYSARFSDPGTKNFKYLPDWILVMDAYAKKEMVAEGFDAKRIVVSGNPYFDTFAKRNFNSGVGKSEIISFFEQPFSEITESAYGFSEMHVLDDLLGALERVGLRKKVIIKLHPRTKNLSKFNRIIKRHTVRVTVNRTMNPVTLIRKSLLVLGMNSMMLFIASLAKKKVLSYQPGLHRPDPLISNRLALSIGVYKKSELLTNLKKAIHFEIKKKSLKTISDYLKNQSTTKVINFIAERVSEKKGLRYERYQT